MKFIRVLDLKIILSAIVMLALLDCGCTRKQPKVDHKVAVEEKTTRMAWWKEARFGMFIHWGLYAIPAGIYRGRPVPSLGEWIMNNAGIPVSEYEKLAEQFNPLEFDADQWVQIAKQAGMKYIVITSKHHDGFGLWDSKVSNWDVMDRTPYKRDILREIEQACKRADMPLGFYYSIMDWHHEKAQGPFFPEYNNQEKSNPLFDEYAEEYMKPQLVELIKGYDIKVLWFDGQWIADWNLDKGRAMYDFVRGLKPDIIVNNRVGQTRTPPGTCQPLTVVGDFVTPEQQVPEDGLPGLDWESCITMNRTWGFKLEDRDWKSAPLLVQVLIDIVSKGGNLLLNVGPTAEGIIPSPSVERLEEMGRWLKTNGESIYGAGKADLGTPRWGRYTAGGAKIYAHVMQWPRDGKLQTAKPTVPVSLVYLLSDPKKTPLKYDVKNAGLTIDVPMSAPDDTATVVVIETQSGT